jgi:hypothetical protein
VTVNFMLINGPGGPPVFWRQVVLSQCDGGVIVSDQVILGIGATPIPTLGELALAVLAIGLAAVGVIFLRK